MNQSKYHVGDCMAVMDQFADESFDALVTDPPFGIGFMYGDSRELNSTAVDYWNWFAPIYSKALSKIKPGGLVAVWQAQLYFRNFWDWFGEDIHIYVAAKNFVQLRNTPINYGYDPVIMQYKVGGAPLRPAKPKRNLDYFVANTAGIISDPTRPERQHPCPRPLDAVLNVVDNFGVEGGTILDPFVGSGTTIIAAERTGRTCHGIDNNPAYLDVFLQRAFRESEGK